MTIYLDVVFFENVVLNYIIILSTAIISKAKISIKRILVASSIGSIFTIFNYVVTLGCIANTIMKLLISLVIVMVAFNSNKVKNILKQLVFFYLVSFTFGGVAFMLLYVISPQNIVIEENHLVGTYPIKVAVLAGGIGFIMIAVVSKIIKDRMSKKSMLCDLEIFYKGKVKKVKTMIDTGNLLKEPITQTDVIIVEKNSLQGLVEQDILDNICNILQGKWLTSQEKLHSYKFKIIPFASLGNDNGLLIGFKPDYIKIYDEEENVRNDVIVAIYDGKLTRTNLYTSLIGLDILKREGDRKHETTIQKVNI